MRFENIKKTILISLILMAAFCVETMAESKVIDNTKVIEYLELPQQKFLSEQLFHNGVSKTILFGHYEQDNNEENGKEPVEWIVLHKNDEDRTAILISKYILDCLPFNGFSENVNWENSSLRLFMNSDMLANMFDNVELFSIVPTYLNNSPNYYNNSFSGNPTTDFLYIPGLDEMFVFFSNQHMTPEGKVNELLRPNVARVCKATEYAVSKGARVLGHGSKHPGACNYFLRTTGLNGRRIWYDDVYADYFQTYVSETGEVKPNGTGINSLDDGIRVMVQVKY